ncbi:MAG: DUF4070 domain-containing protein, partial [Acidobacteria bacterium]|nr:DUF4070 domain-containing protein [Acidobacteriota bacterium]
SIGTTSTALNFVPEMDPEVLIEGYRRVTASVYDPTLENYFERCLTFFEHLKPVPHLHKPQSKIALYANMMGLRRQLSAKQVPAYMRFITHVSKDHPRMLPEAIRLAALGYHFDKVTRQQMAIHDFKVFLEAEAEIFRKNSSSSVQEVEELGARRQQLFMRAQARNQLIPEDFRYHGDGIESALESFRSSVNAQAENFTRSAAV